MVTYNDPVHGSRWQLTAFELAMVNHPSLLQLRGKKQLGLTDYLFTSATHSRYTHSVGVGLSARRLAQALALSEQETLTLQAAAFLHDIGHAPFSHAVEDALGSHHEEVTQRVLRGDDFGAIEAKEVLATLTQFSIDPLIVADTLAGKNSLSQFIAHDVIDADRIDYLPRDLLAANVGHSIDLDWLYAKLTLVDGTLGVKRSGVGELELFMVTRARAYDAIYFHGTKQAGEIMLKEAIRADPSFGSGLKAPDSFAQEIHRLSDSELLRRLLVSESAVTRELAARIKAGPARWYRTVLLFGGPPALVHVKLLMPQRDALRATLLREGFFCEFTSPVKRLVLGAPPPAFSVDDGTSFWDRPVAHGAWYHVPDRLFAVYAREDTPAIREKVRVIIEKFFNS